MIANRAHSTEDREDAYLAEDCGDWFSWWKGLSVLRRIFPSDPPTCHADTCSFRFHQSRFCFYNVPMQQKMVCCSKKFVWMKQKRFALKSQNCFCEYKKKLRFCFYKCTNAAENGSTQKRLLRHGSRRRHRCKFFVLLKHCSKKKSGEVILSETSLEMSEQKIYTNVLPPFENIRCFSFVKRMYLDIF
jgi:hypothetical protein